MFEKGCSKWIRLCWVLLTTMGGLRRPEGNEMGTKNGETENEQGLG